MIALDTAQLIENPRLPPEFLIQPPAPDALLSIATATTLPPREVARAFNELTSTLNAETISLLTSRTQLEHQLLTTLSDSPKERVGADQSQPDLLLKTFQFFSQRPLPHSPEGLTLDLNLADSLSTLNDRAQLTPEAPGSLLLHRLVVFVSGLAAQWQNSNKPASQLDKELIVFYEKIAREHNLDGGKRKDVIGAYTDQDKLTDIMITTLRRMLSLGELNPGPGFLLAGCGKAEVEGKILSSLGLDKTPIDGIDILPADLIGEHWSGMNLHEKTNILDWSKRATKYSGVFVLGSGWPNNPNPLSHLQYFNAAAESLVPGGVLFYETRALEPDPTHNAAAMRSESHMRIFPHKLPGASTSVHIPEGYESAPSIQLQPHQLLILYAELCGFEMLNHPLSNPAATDRQFARLRGEWGEGFIEQIKGLTPTKHDAIIHPFWVAGKDNYRTILIMKKVRPSAPMVKIIDRLFAYALEHPLRLQASSPEPVATS